MAGVEMACHLQEIIFASGHFNKSLWGSRAVYGVVGSTVLWIARHTVRNCFCSLHLYYGYWIWFKRSWHQRVVERFIIREVQCISLWTQKRNVRNNIKMKGIFTCEMQVSPAADSCHSVGYRYFQKLNSKVKTKICSMQMFICYH